MAVVDRIAVAIHNTICRTAILMDMRRDHPDLADDVKLTPRSWCGLSQATHSSYACVTPQTLAAGFPR